ncbi:MAG: acyl carrier protein [Mycobacterium sp.]|jgi:acyl carrier protein|nr:acyl carrier protein [Mycobacterium sp.]
MDKEQLYSLLKLEQDADLETSFEDLGVDSWNLVETRAALEVRHGIRLVDDDWLLLESPGDILRLFDEAQR